MKGDIHLYKFDPQVYPRLLWVCLDAKEEAIGNVFDFPDSNYNGFLDKCYMMVSRVTHRETGRHGFLVSAKHKKDVTIGNIAHESIHVADGIYEDCNVFPHPFSQGNEAYAYLVGWVADCINKAKSGKID